MEETKKIRARLTVVQFNRLSLGEWLKKYNSPLKSQENGRQKKA